jgi:hypothetical protein
MSFEKRVLEVVANVTDVPADFYNGTLFLETSDSKVAVAVFNAIYEQIDKAVIFGKASCTETYYDFV